MRMLGSPVSDEEGRVGIPGFSFAKNGKNEEFYFTFPCISAIIYRTMQTYRK